MTGKTLRDHLDENELDPRRAWMAMTGASEAEMELAKQLLDSGAMEESDQPLPGRGDYCLDCKPFAFGRALQVARAVNAALPVALFGPPLGVCWGYEYRNEHQLTWRYATFKGEEPKTRGEAQGRLVELAKGWKEGTELRLVETTQSQAGAIVVAPPLAEGEPNERQIGFVGGR